MNSFHHVDGLVCPACEDKLSRVHPYLAQWFRMTVKREYPSAHVSWSDRDEASQEAAFAAGTTKLHYPESAHNHTENGKPLSYALDLFQQVSGKAVWDKNFFQSLADAIEAAGLPIFWGGKWRALGDNDHFQYRAS